jgi:hypothetical protein
MKTMPRATSPLFSLFVLLISSSALAAQTDRSPKALWKMDEVKGAALRIDGKAAVRGRDFRLGSVRTLDGTDLVVWIKVEAARPVKVALAPQ